MERKRCQQSSRRPFRTALSPSISAEAPGASRTHGLTQNLVRALFDPDGDLSGLGNDQLAWLFDRVLRLLDMRPGIIHPFLMAIV